MRFVEDYEDAVQVSMHPLVATRKSMSFEKSFATYYKTSALPLAIMVIAEILFGSVTSSIINRALLSYPLLSTLSAWIATGFVVLLVVGTILFMWVIVPIGLLIDALLLHFFGKYIFKNYKNNFESTLSAVVYATMPFLMLSWLMLIPLLGLLLLLIAAVWDFIVLVYAIANLHKITRRTAVLTIVGSWILALIIKAVLFFL